MNLGLPRNEKIKKVGSMTQSLVEAHGTGFLVTGSRRVPITDRAFVIGYNRERNRTAEDVGYPVFSHRDYLAMAKAAGMTIPNSVLAAVEPKSPDSGDAQNRKPIYDRKPETKTGIGYRAGQKLSYVNSVHMRRRPTRWV